MYKQLTSEQRSQIFVLLQKKTSRKELAELVKISQSTLSRELKRNSTAKGHYLWKQAQEKSEERRVVRRATAKRMR
jgi:IS30 family transposase